MSLFGSTTNTTTQQPSLFQPQTTTSLFAPQTQQSNTSSLFGAQPQQSNNNIPSLFGAQPQQSNPSSLFAPQQQQQQQPQQQQSFQQSTFNPNASHLSLPQQTDLARSRLLQSGLNPPPVDKPILAQASTLIQKWDPQSQDTLLQSYLYNVVHAAYAPFYNKNDGESEEKWERALATAPKSEVEGEKYVPVLVRGFYDLGLRVEYQANMVRQMRARLHEMMGSLEAVMQVHQQRLTVMLEQVRRKHVVQEERILRLAVKVQVLRNRGYALDMQEEALRRQLLELKEKVLEPSFRGREEEVWARMVVLRERARWLEQEGKKVGGVVAEQGGKGEALPEYVVQKTKRILGDYEAQLKHLAREVEDVGKEFEAWKEGKGK